MRVKSWFVYILLCDDNTLYTGITTDLKKRLKEHQSGQGAKYTRSRGAKEIVYSKEYSNRSEAAVREAELKKLTRVEKMKLF